MYAYLTMISGARAGTSFRLDAREEQALGRGTECAVVLSDPLCSRIHATLVQQHGTWHVRDAESRNGTFVNGQKIDEATLAIGDTLRVGSTEFSLQEADLPPTSTVSVGQNVAQAIVQERPVSGREVDQLTAAAVRTLEDNEELLLLYQMTIKLLGCENPDDVVRLSLDLLREHTQAAVSGFLWVSDEGQLRPKISRPHGTPTDVTLNSMLTELVCRQGHAVWVANQSPPERNQALAHYTDAICAPLIHDQLTQGAIHVYRAEGRFRQSDFEFTISVANIVAVALVRAQTQATMRTDYQRLVEVSPGYDELIGESSPMRELKAKVGRLAQATGCVLIRGESGTGKELVARALHQKSPRPDRPILSVNCAAIPTDLMESQLFGHQAGAFTGAERDHIGFFEQADMGTLFLDEVGEMTLQGQAKLLRILEGHPFLPVGASKEIEVDVRIIAATNRDLKAYVTEGKFRDDLYYRLTVFELFVPPLRDRGTDIELLINFFLEHYRQQHGRPNLELADAARAKLLAYRWPGNVRQLRNLVDSAVVLAEGVAIEESDLALNDRPSWNHDSLRIDEWERWLITEALQRTRGNIPEAAKLLGIGRATLYRKVEQHGISR